MDSIPLFAPLRTPTFRNNPQWAHQPQQFVMPGLQTQAQVPQAQQFPAPYAFAQQPQFITPPQPTPPTFHAKLSHPPPHLPSPPATRPRLAFPTNRCNLPNWSNSFPVQPNSFVPPQPFSRAKSIVRPARFQAQQLPVGSYFPAQQIPQIPQMGYMPMGQMGMVRPSTRGWGPYQSSWRGRGRPRPTLITPKQIERDDKIKAENEKKEKGDAGEEGMQTRSDTEASEVREGDEVSMVTGTEKGEEVSTGDGAADEAEEGSNEVATVNERMEQPTEVTKGKEVTKETNESKEATEVTESVVTSTENKESDETMTGSLKDGEEEVKESKTIEEVK
eukprot:GHVN01102514.1.p1 GENE.GHVN01102514.1~~GHVN01102514.1.p1  ORF type:complete len:333 (+),score=92.05 GHVN01102514.1:137-1135(+)